MIDTHAHLQDEKMLPCDVVIENANKAGVNKIICSSSDIETSKKAVLIANNYECVYATVGVHPEEANTFNETSLKELEKLANSCGLRISFIPR